MTNYNKYLETSKKDKRLGKRTVKVLEQLSANPGKSVCSASGGKANAKAAYRLLSNKNFDDKSVLAIQREQTIERINENDAEVVLIAEDTTIISYNELKETKGLGPINENENSRGMLLHSALAISGEGQPLGILAQKKWTRDREDFGKKNRRKQESIENKESYKWIEVMKEAEVKKKGVITIHICDRESDIYEFFAYAQKNESNFLCRRTYNRRLDEAELKIDEYMKQTKSSGIIVLEVPRDSHNNYAARKAELSVKFRKVNVACPKNLKNNNELPESVELYAITAEEENPPEGFPPISWKLFTNMEICSFEKAVQYIEYYTKRWLIERFHYVLKSGCSIEKAQLKTLQGLFNLEALYSVIAFEILYLTYLARTRPNANCDEILGESEWQMLYCIVNKTKIPPKTPLTILEAIILLAKLGGFLARKSDGFPGVKVLWNGISKYRAIIGAVPYLSAFIDKE